MRYLLDAASVLRSRWTCCSLICATTAISRSQLLVSVLVAALIEADWVSASEWRAEKGSVATLRGGGVRIAVAVDSPAVLSASSSAG